MDPAAPLCGPERPTGPTIAKHWAAVPTGREAIYAGNDIQPFVGVMRQNIPGLTDWGHRGRILGDVTGSRSGRLRGLR